MTRSVTIILIFIMELLVAGCKAQSITAAPSPLTRIYEVKDLLPSNYLTSEVYIEPTTHREVEEIRKHAAEIRFAPASCGDTRDINLLLPEGTEIAGIKAENYAEGVVVAIAIAVNPQPVMPSVNTDPSCKTVTFTGPTMFGISAQTEPPKVDNISIHASRSIIFAKVGQWHEVTQYLYLANLDSNRVIFTTLITEQYRKNAAFNADDTAEIFVKAVKIMQNKA